ncbi:MAG TPA: CPXCG motif-containing cysteine-rich protein [Candidatus Thiothrix moscowensis]|uniref:CPXCG motif-containing cysteine-rich protein n=1 Tax=unclassified Thiothrix TaxID=2636184 RepID=UPI0025D8D5DB|nr:MULTISPECIES: CPXCG motif-containing cysteine-rich protein [unclassified Thiothrix]HRJ51291.1 CPXCG motif-containing cysteine-rich protein [Candidatus Thiothrix moscowensis]HRJ91654.1 CPXCG motif-containing cysteine-rich protein [Candidatus Thiothrix moscowensis]
MSQVLTHTNITCPYCYSDFSTEIDITAGSQDYYEDCHVCCNPVQLFIHIDTDGEITGIDVTPGNE